jgi:serine/threonine protein kinase
MKPLPQNSLVQNRYLVVQLIGKGGMGEVYLAVDQRLGSAVAIKRTVFREDEALGSAFEREAKILARLRHPVLPKVIDHFIETEGQFLVMEHISGDDLAKRLESAGKPFPLSWVMFWADQLLDALNYLHSHEPPIIHRDIKPQNLKLTDDNHVVLLDFGLSKDFDTNVKSEPAGSGSVVGYSPHFASMEQVRGTGTDARSDLYSLSATLYQLLTNTVPPDALTRADDLLGGHTDPLLPINVVNRHVTSAISAVVLKGLSVRQDERFANAAEMQKALRRAFNQGKKGQEAETVMLPLDTKPAAEEVVATAGGDHDEVKTQARIKVPASVMPKPSEIKTEVFPAGSVPSVDKEAVPDAAPAMAVAAAAAAAQPAPSSQPKAKKSKAGVVIGGLLGLLVLGGIAIGGGWYFYNNYSAAAVASPTPAPSVEASPAPTTEVVTESNTNTDLTESNTATDTTEPQDARPTPQAVTKAPGRTSQSPTAKATPKPKAKDDRTVILQ